MSGGSSMGIMSIVERGHPCTILHELAFSWRLIHSSRHLLVPRHTFWLKDVKSFKHNAEQSNAIHHWFEKGQQWHDTNLDLVVADDWRDDAYYASTWHHM